MYYKLQHHQQSKIIFNKFWLSYCWRLSIIIYKSSHFWSGHSIALGALGAAGKGSNSSSDSGSSSASSFVLTIPSSCAILRVSSEIWRIESKVWSGLNEPSSTAKEIEDVMHIHDRISLLSQPKESKQNGHLRLALKMCACMQSMSWVSSTFSAMSFPLLTMFFTTTQPRSTISKFSLAIVFSKHSTHCVL